MTNYRAQIENIIPEIKARKNQYNKKTTSDNPEDQWRCYYRGCVNELDWVLLQLKIILGTQEETYEICPQCGERFEPGNGWFNKKGVEHCSDMCVMWSKDDEDDDDDTDQQ